MDAKNILTSKTLWTNVIMAALVFANQQWPTLNLSPDVQAAIVAAVNVILRLMTKQPATILPAQ